MPETTSKWSKPEDRRLLRMWLAEEPPRTTREIADALDRSKSAVYRRIRAYDADGHKGDRKLYERITGKSIEPAIRPVRVETRDLPDPDPVPQRYSAVVWGDVHIPFQDPDAVEVFKQIVSEVDPEKLFCIGDVFDFWQISNYRPPKNPDKDFQETLNGAARHLAEVYEIANPNEAHFFAGNHEDRWDRMMLKAREDVRFRQLLKLPKIRRALEFEEVAGFEELGYEYHPYVEGGIFIENDDLILTHGEHANKYVARKMLDIYGMNVMFGHAHRIQNFTRRDVKGQEAGFSIGCLCDIDPHYDNTQTDWHQGFAVVTFGPNYFNVEQVRIHDGTAIYRGKEYSA